MKILITFFLLQIMTGCGGIINILNNSKPESYTRVSNTTFLKEISTKKIYFSVTNTTHLEAFNNIKQTVMDNISRKNANISFADSEKNANVIISINIRQFFKSDQNTLDNVERYWQYTDTVDNTTIPEINPGSAIISDKNLGFSDSGGKTTPIPRSENTQESIFSKIAKNDFASGMVFGGLIGFWAGGSTPIGATIGSIVGGSMTYMFQKYTQPSTYVTLIDIEIAERIPFAISHNQKYLHREDDNGLRWSEFKEVNNMKYRRIRAFSVVKQSISDQNNAALQAIKSINATITNIFISNVQN